MNTTKHPLYIYALHIKSKQIKLKTILSSTLNADSWLAFAKIIEQRAFFLSSVFQSCPAGISMTQISNIFALQEQNIVRWDKIENW